MDLNADVGEGFGAWRSGDDEALLGIVTSANVACGFHAGDPSIMLRTCALAAERGVRIGAHVGYRDLAGFGRRALDVPPETLSAEVTYQLGALAACAARAGSRVTYVKPHGALYHRCASDPGAADAVVVAARAFGDLRILGPPASALLRAAATAGLEPVAEGFADRAYTREGGLAERGTEGALLSPAAAGAQAAALAAGFPIETADGGTLRLDVGSLCVHGDTPGAAEVARAVRRALEDAGTAIGPFT
jgi:UPF0271 protein